MKHRAACFYGFGLRGVGCGQFELLKVRGFAVILSRGILIHLAVAVLAPNSIKSKGYKKDQSPSAVF